MDGLLKFSDYDIFGYLASGVVVLCLLDVAFGTNLILSADWTIGHSIVVVVAAYVSGQVIAPTTTLLMDRLLVRGLMGVPANLLMRPQPPKPRGIDWRKWLWAGYFEPLPAEVQRRVMERAQLTTQDDETGEKAFVRAWPVIKRDPLPYARMESFMRQYGFCRNMSFTALIAAVTLFTRPPTEVLPVESCVPAWVALFVSVVMFHRYLKFFRAYSYEVFTTYAEPAPEAKTAGA